MPSEEVKKFNVDYPLLRGALVECLGTMFILLLGAGTLYGGLHIGADVIHASVAGAIVFGLAYAAISISCGHFSGNTGGQFNPVLSLILVALHGGVTIVRTLAYLAAQLVGAILAGLIVWGFHKDMLMGPSAMPTYETGLAFVAEMLGTFMLGTVYLQARGHPLTGLALGGIYTSGLLTFGCQGALFNPFFSFSLAIFSNDWTDIFVPLIGPLVGGVLAVLLQIGLSFMGNKSDPKKDDDHASNTGSQLRVVGINV